MSRPLSWYPLAGSDPVPGDPAAVRTAGEDYRAVATAIQSAAEALATIADIEGSVSYAVDQIREKATEVAEDIRKARDRYEGVGAALVTYASALDSAQVDSAAALADATAAQSAIDSANATITSASTAALDATDVAAQESSAQTLSRAREDRDDAEARLAAARGRLDDAVAARDAAARTAIDAIGEATAHDGLKDSFWDNVGGALSSVFKVISKIAGIISAVAGVLSLVLCWVPVLGAALGAVAIIASAVKLVADIALLSWGEGSWADVAWGAFAVASFGIGRVLSTGAQSVTKGAAGIARGAAGRAAATSNASRAARSLPIGPARPAIQTMVGPTIGWMTRSSARLLVVGGRAKTWLGGGLQSLRPGAIVKDITALRQFSWTSAMAKVRSNFGLAGRSPAADIAATQADDVLTGAVRATDEVSPALRAATPAVNRALTGATVAQGASYTMVGLGAVDTIGGLQAIHDHFTSGKPIALPIVDAVTSFTDLAPASGAEQLKLDAK